MNSLSATPIQRIANTIFCRLYSQNQMGFGGGSFFWENSAKAMIMALTHLWYDMNFTKSNELQSASALLECSSIKDIIYAMKNKKLSEETKLTVEVYLVDIGVDLSSAQKLSQSAVATISIKAEEQHAFNLSNLIKVIDESDKY